MVECCPNHLASSLPAAGPDGGGVGAVGGGGGGGGGSGGATAPAAAAPDGGGGCDAEVARLGRVAASRESNRFVSAVSVPGAVAGGDVTGSIRDVAPTVSPGTVLPTEDGDDDSSRLPSRQTGPPLSTNRPLNRFHIYASMSPGPCEKNCHAGSLKLCRTYRKRVL